MWATIQAFHATRPGIASRDRPEPRCPRDPVPDLHRVRVHDPSLASARVAGAARTSRTSSPRVPLVAGAAGISGDFAGRPLGARRLVEGRTSIVHAANESTSCQVLALIAKAQARRY
jgi:hypothetical protein